MFLRLTFWADSGPPPSSFLFNIANGAPMPTTPTTSSMRLSQPAARRAYGNYWASKQADYHMKHLPGDHEQFLPRLLLHEERRFPGNQNLKPLHAVHTAREAAEQDAIIPEPRDAAGPQHAGHHGRLHAVKEHIDKCTVDAGGMRCMARNTRAPVGPALHNYRRMFFPGSRLEMMTFASARSMCPQIISGRQTANRGVGGPSRPGSAASQIHGRPYGGGAGHWAHEEQPEIVSKFD
jgi:hypothetical protein